MNVINWKGKNCYHIKFLFVNRIISQSESKQRFYKLYFFHVVFN